MVLTIIVIIVMLVISGGLVALYREVGFGRAGDAPRGDASHMDPRPTTSPLMSSRPTISPLMSSRPTTSPLMTSRPTTAGPTTSQPALSEWPLGSLTAGSHFAVPTGEPYTGFLGLCADDHDSLGELHSAAVVAEDWGYPMLVAIAKTTQPNGWIDRLDGLPGNIGQYDIGMDELRALRPARLPVVTFINEGRLLDASVSLDSPASIATSFQHCRFGLTR